MLWIFLIPWVPTHYWIYERTSRIVVLWNYMELKNTRTWATFSYDIYAPNQTVGSKWWLYRCLGISVAFCTLSCIEKREIGIWTSVQGSRGCDWSLQITVLWSKWASYLQTGFMWVWITTRYLTLNNSLLVGLELILEFVNIWERLDCSISLLDPDHSNMALASPKTTTACAYCPNWQIYSIRIGLSLEHNICAYNWNYIQEHLPNLQTVKIEVPVLHVSQPLFGAFENDVPVSILFSSLFSCQ